MGITQNWETGRSCHHPPLRGQDREDVFPLKDGLSELHTHALTLTRSHTHNTTILSPSPRDFGTPSHSPGPAQPHFTAEVVTGGASLEEMWINLSTVLFAAELLALPRAPRLVMSKWKQKETKSLLHSSSIHPCPCRVPRAASLERGALSHGHLQLHMKSPPSNQELCNLCFHFKASFSFCRGSGGMGEVFKAQS